MDTYDTNDQRLSVLFSLFLATFSSRNLKHAIQEALLSSPNKLMTTTISVTNKSSCYYRPLQLLLIISVLIIISMIDADVSISGIIFIF